MQGRAFMSVKSKAIWEIAIGLIAAIGILAAQYLAGGQSNAWLWGIGLWAVCSAAFELYAGLRSRRR